MKNLIKGYRGFTLAEVLITLVIIGVVAALTMPILIAKIQNELTKQKLLKTQAILENAYTRKVADANPMSADGISNAIMSGGIDKYVKVTRGEHGYTLSNGIYIRIHTISYGNIIEVHTNGKPIGKTCKDVFAFVVGSSDLSNRLVHPLGTFDSLYALFGGRDWPVHRDEAIAFYSDISLDPPGNAGSEYKGQENGFNCTATILGEKGLTIEEVTNYNH